MDCNNQGSVAFVTGGSSGIGKAIVEKIAQQGGKAIIIDINEVGEELACNLGGNVIFIKADVTSEEDVTLALDEAKRRFGGINVVVNCAGIVEWGVPYDFEASKACPLEIYKRVMDVNALGTFNVSRLAAGMMATNVPDENQQRGVIINIASIMATDPREDMCAYAISKAAVKGMTLPLARCFATKGIRVVCLCPGFTATPMLAGYPQEAIDQLMNSVNLSPKRLAKPEEIAHMVQCIIENPYINAETINISGGYHYSK
ncbi:3-hydroxyacyl-CoA dehydrogenase type-2-like [Chelonus insularis]|uniref:3-hydroxyacyl-CoA dehydrogenase type-2-like n=1 Tax=Chelonus insularis TaxID=460826 RepID=UPI001588AB92|nr:3-hydroxyacyl-CoA dehydrogenase type-2-like [Chelonus insularis]